MAEKPYAVLDTREDFDKWFEKIYNDGYESGYKDGLVRAIGHIYDAIDENFDDEVREKAVHEARRISMTNWKRRYAYEEELKKFAVNEYIKKEKEKTEAEG